MVCLTKAFNNKKTFTMKGDMITNNLDTIKRWLEEGATVERDGFLYKPEDATKVVEKSKENPEKAAACSSAKRLRKMISNLRNFATETRQISLFKEEREDTGSKEEVASGSNGFFNV